MRILASPDAPPPHAAIRMYLGLAEGMAPTDTASEILLPKVIEIVILCKRNLHSRDKLVRGSAVRPILFDFQIKNPRNRRITIYQFYDLHAF